MSFLRRRLFRRFTLLGRVADLVLVGGAALRFAHRRGWLTDDQVARAGFANWSATNPLSAGDLLLAGGAAWRLLRRNKSEVKQIRV